MQVNDPKPREGGHSPPAYSPGSECSPPAPRRSHFILANRSSEPVTPAWDIDHRRTAERLFTGSVIHDRLSRTRNRPEETRQSDSSSIFPARTEPVSVGPPGDTGMLTLLDSVRSQSSDLDE